MDVWIIALIGIIAFVLGAIIGRIVGASYHASGSIVINTLEEDADRYSIIIKDPIDDLPKKDYVIFKVEVMKPQK